MNDDYSHSCSDHCRREYGDGYYSDYPVRKRAHQAYRRNATELSSQPIMASTLSDIHALPETNDCPPEEWLP